MSHADSAVSAAPVSDTQWRQFLDRYADGGVLDGRIHAVAPFGALVEIDGVQGLLPRTAWTSTPEVGSTVAVRIERLDLEHRRFSLTAA